MPDTPWDMIARSQRAAVGLIADAASTLVEMGKTGVTRPDEVLKELTAFAAAVGDLAGSTARPLEFFLDSQRQLAETMSAFAVLQRQLADVMETAASNQAAIVQALEMMTSPVLAVADKVRSESPTAQKAATKAGKKATKRSAAEQSRGTASSREQTETAAAASRRAAKGRSSQTEG